MADTARPSGGSPDHAQLARSLASRSSQGALSTLARDPSGYPFGSLVAVAFDERGRPLLLISRLAEHTQNLEHDGRASLLLYEPASAGNDPLASGRVTLLGRCARVPEGEAEAAKKTFLGAHPEASSYAAFADFALYRLEVEAVRYVGGFGRMSWVDAAAYAAG